MSTSQPIDVRDMAIVHRTFRSAYEESAQLVRAAMTDEVSHEHQVVQTALNSALAACATWRHHPTVETGEALAATLEHLNEVLQPHLDDEEQQVVPLAAVTLTQEEWDAVGEHSSSQIPRARRAVALGMILEPLDEDDRNYMKRDLPGPVRLLYPLMIQRPWTKYASMLRSGT